jgi:hypothetical protein
MDMRATALLGSSFTLPVRNFLTPTMGHSNSMAQHAIGRCAAQLLDHERDVHAVEGKAAEQPRDK